MDANITSLPTRSCSRGKTYCDALNLHFPRIFLVTNAADFDGHNGPHHYSLDADQTLYGNSAVVEEIEQPQTHGNSVILRYHQTAYGAGQYMIGFQDGAPNQSAQLRTNPDGTFTLVEIPTQPHWPSPIILYDAFHTNEEQPLGFTHWQRAVLPSGQVLNQDELDALFI